MSFTTKLNDLSLDLKNYINDIDTKLGFKHRKTCGIDAVLFKILQTVTNSNQEKIKTKLNLFNNNDASRIAYLKRIDQMDLSIFDNMYEYFNKQTDHYFNTSNTNNDYICS